MHFVLIGASGRTGQLVVKDALLKGHTVTALVRRPDALNASSELQNKENNARVAIVTGSPTSEADLKKAFSTVPDFTKGITKPDAVIVTLAHSQASGNPFSAPIVPKNFMADVHSTLLKAMAEAGINKIVTMSAFGSGNTQKNLNFMLKALFKYSGMRDGMEDHGEVEKRIVAQSKTGKLQYVLVRPPMLTDGPAAAVKDRGELGDDMGMMDKISRASTADFLVDAAAEQKWNGRSLVISN